MTDRSVQSNELGNVLRSEPSGVEALLVCDEFISLFAIHDVRQMLVQELADKKSGAKIGIGIVINGQRLLLRARKVGIGVEFSLHDISSVKLSDVKGAVSQTSLFDELVSRITRVHSLVPGLNCQDLEIGVLPRGQKLRVINHGVVVINFSVLKPTYYDLYAQVGGTMFNYSTRGSYHSGDKKVCNFLVQYLHNLTDGNWLIGASGWSQKMLSEYRTNNPFLVIVDRESQKLWIIPVALDVATIGNAKTCAPVACVVSGGYAYFEVLNNPPNNDNEMTVTHRMMEHARHATIFDPPEAAVTSEGGERSGSEEKNSGSGAVTVPTSVEKSVVGTGPVLIIEAGLVGHPLIDQFRELVKPVGIVHFAQRVCFLGPNGCLDQTLHAPVKFDPNILGDPGIVAPFMAKQVKGGPALVMRHGLAVPLPEATFDKAFEFFNYKFPIIFVTTNMISEVCGEDDMRFEGLIVVVPTPEEVPPGQSEDNFRKSLAGLSQQAVLAFAAPKSTVVAYIDDEFYYLRGVSIPELIENCAFGALQPDFMTRLSEVVTGMIPDGNPVVNINEVPLEVVGLRFTPNDFQIWLNERSFDEVIEMKQQILDAMEQICTKYSGGQTLKDVSERLCKIMSSKITAVPQSEREEMKKIIMAAIDGDEGAKKILCEKKGTRTRRKRLLQQLINAAGRMISQRNAGTKNFSLKQQKKKNNIGKNVDKVKNMDEGSLDVLMEKCQTIGALVMAASGLPKYLTVVSDDSLIEDDHFLRLLCGDCMRPNHRMMVLNGITVSAMLGLVPGNLDMQKHSLVPDDVSRLSPVLPNGLGDVESRIPALVWLLPDMIIGNDNPFNIVWATMADREEFALPRIMMRGLLSNNCSNREHPIDAGSKTLTWLLLGALLKSMIEFAKLRNSPVTPDDKDSQFCQVMRGMMGVFLATAGSGTSPVTFCWQLISNNRAKVPKTHNDWVLIHWVCRLFPLTGWDVAPLRRKLLDLLTRTIKKVLADPVTQCLRDAKVESKKAKRAGHVAVVYDLNINWFKPYGFLLEHFFEGSPITHTQEELIKARDALLESDKDSYCVDMMIAVLNGGDQPDNFKKVLTYAHRKYGNEIHRTRGLVFYLLTKDGVTNEEVMVKLSEFEEYLANAEKIYGQQLHVRDKFYIAELREVIKKVDSTDPSQYKKLAHTIYKEDRHNMPRRLTGKKLLKWVEAHQIPGEWKESDVAQMGWLPFQRHVVLNKLYAEEATVSSGGGSGGGASCKKVVTKQMEPHERVLAEVSASVMSLPPPSYVSLCLTGEIRPAMKAIMNAGENDTLIESSMAMFPDLVRFACAGDVSVDDVLIGILKITIEKWECDGPTVAELVHSHFRDIGMYQ